LCKLGAFRMLKHAQLSAAVLGAALYAMALAGCAPNSNANASIRPNLRSPIPLPARALLEAQPEPHCDFQINRVGDGLLDTDAAALEKLDYERQQCYRKAETITRNRLRLLQAAVAKTLKAVKRGERQEHIE
jgi:hypothetical protein